MRKSTNKISFPKKYLIIGALVLAIAAIYAILDYTPKQTITTGEYKNYQVK